MSVFARRSCLAACLILVMSGFAVAADKKELPPIPPPDLDGRTFTVTFPTEDRKPKEKLVFKDGKLTITSLGDLEITYKAQVKANWKHEVSETAFSGTAKAADGAQIEIQGNAMLDGEIRGSITRREKDVDATARNFNGKQTGAQPKKK